MSESSEEFHYGVGVDAGLGHDETACSPESFRGCAPAGLDDLPALSFSSSEAARYSNVRQRPPERPVPTPALS